MQLRFTPILTLFLCISLINSDVMAQGQGTQTEFGKNRVQYKDFDWFYFRSPKFDTYYYRNGKELAATVGKIAEQQYKEIEDILDYKLDRRLQIMAYNKAEDVAQTNLGLNTSVTFNTGGLTPIIGGRIFVYFDGNHEHLTQQIRGGIARAIISEMLYGNSIQEKVQNSTLLVLPDWYIDGLVAYLSENWSVNMDNTMKDLVLSNPKLTMNGLVYSNSLLAGHSIWKYAVDNFGAGSISNILYMTRINLSAESGFYYIIGMDFKALGKSWKTYYTKLYEGADAGLATPAAELSFLPKANKKAKRANYLTYSVSPRGNRYAYTIFKKGRYNVYTYDILKKKATRVFRSNVRIYSNNAEALKPIVAWHPSGELLAISYQNRSEAEILVANLRNKKDNEVIKMYKYQKINALEYSSEGRRWVLSAMANGQSDIYVFNILSRRDEAITNDVFDDLYPAWQKNTDKIIFSSNRTTDTLSNTKRYDVDMVQPTLDLFLYDYPKKDIVLRNITNTPYFNEIKTQYVDTTKLLYLSDANGLWNLNALRIDSAIAYSYDTTIFYTDTTITVWKDTFSTQNISNYSRNIDEYSVWPQNNTLYLLQKQNNVNRMVRNVPLDSNEVNTDASTFMNMAVKSLQLKDEKRKKKLVEISKLNSTDTTATAIQKRKAPYFFVNDFPQLPPTKADSLLPNKVTATAKKFQKSKSLDDYFGPSLAKPYLPIFSTNYLVTQIDNGVLTNTYQLYGIKPLYFNNNVNALIKIGTTDLLEDYRFTGGFRINSRLSIPEYFLTFENLKKRLDKQITFYKQTNDERSDIVSVKRNSYEIQGRLKYPFSDAASLRFMPFFRHDEIVVQSTFEQTLAFPTPTADHAGAKLEYVYDNSVSTGVNLYNGTRYKLYAEYFRQIDRNAVDKNVSITNVGFDARHYEKISRQIIAAFRLAGASSMGKERVAYFLGGVDNWIPPRYNEKIQVLNEDKYLYQALATNMRGFQQNIRNGNNFMTFNAEIRVPIVQYFSKAPIRSDFLKNFQIVPFADIGSAWVGRNPFSEENTLNKRTVNTGNLTVTIIEPKYPIVAGFGSGLRSRLFGYFFRFDIARGIDNGKLNQQNVYYFSLSTDF